MRNPGCSLNRGQTVIPTLPWPLWTNLAFSRGFLAVIRPNMHLKIWFHFQLCHQNIVYRVLVKKSKSERCLEPEHEWAALWAPLSISWTLGERRSFFQIMSAKRAALTVFKEECNKSAKRFSQKIVIFLLHSSINWQEIWSYLQSIALCYLTLY